MMRYERVASEECVPLSNGKKPTLKTTSTKHQDLSSENGRTPIIPIYSNGSSSSSRFRSPSSKTPDQSSSHLNASPQLENSNGSADLFQWGQKKRSRASRTSTDDSSSSSSAPFAQAKQQTSTKIQKRRLNLAQSSSSPVEKLSMPPPPPPPPPPSVAAASNGRRRSTKESSSSGGIRNSEDRSYHGNGVGRVNSRSTTSTVVGKRSSPSLSPEKVDKKKTPSFGWSPKNEKSNKSPEAKNQNSSISTATAVADGEKGIAKVLEWPRIYLTLSRKEKEDDFLAMKGTKLPHRPKKRPKTLDRTLQYCFPGMWLSDLTRGRYEVREKKSAKKQKRRGLKGMESMDSDSES